MLPVGFFFLLTPSLDVVFGECSIGRLQCLQSSLSTCLTYTSQQAIQQDKDYLGNKKYYDGLLDPKTTRWVIQKAEEISKSLQRRYVCVCVREGEYKGILLLY